MPRQLDSRRRDLEEMIAKCRVDRNEARDAGDLSENEDYTAELAKFKELSKELSKHESELKDPRYGNKYRVVFTKENQGTCFDGILKSSKEEGWDKAVEVIKESDALALNVILVANEESYKLFEDDNVYYCGIYYKSLGELEKVEGSGSAYITIRKVENDVLLVKEVK